MDSNKYTRSLAKELRTITIDGTLDRDTKGQVAIELLDNDLKRWAFYVTAHEGQFAGIQHDFILELHCEGTYVGKQLFCNTTTCHPNVSGYTNNPKNPYHDVCISIDKGVNTLMGYANMLLFLMINPDYDNPFDSYASRQYDTAVLKCFNDGQISQYHNGFIVPLILVNDKPDDTLYRIKGRKFKLENHRAVPTT